MSPYASIYVIIGDWDTSISEFTRSVNKDDSGRYQQSSMNSSLFFNFYER